jgi:adenosylhomocysteine nucleosidase
VIAAFPGELAPLVRGWRRLGTNAPGSGLWVLGSEHRWVAACAGSGALAVERAFTLAASQGPLGAVVSYGLAGALRTGLKPGTAHWVSAGLSVDSGAAWSALHPAKGAFLLTSPRIEPAEGKADLLRRFPGSDLVDMEAGALARLAEKQRLPFYCLKGVSDGAEESLPDFTPFLRADGTLALTSLVTHFAVRPNNWKKLIDLARVSAAAAKAMRETWMRSNIPI